mmetsp:Transcript_13779/g.35075  ORF Transcript_13779/g.35075 Transcript_13779/m.35075 type:complete len:220 (+) Transcript_13779:1493-2152(+)
MAPSFAAALLPSARNEPLSSESPSIGASCPISFAVCLSSATWLALRKRGAYSRVCVHPRCSNCVTRLCAAAAFISALCAGPLLSSASLTSSRAFALLERACICTSAASRSCSATRACERARRWLFRLLSAAHRLTCRCATANSRPSGVAPTTSASDSEPFSFETRPESTGAFARTSLRCCTARWAEGKGAGAGSGAPALSMYSAFCSCVFACAARPVRM